MDKESIKGVATCNRYAEKKNAIQALHLFY